MTNINTEQAARTLFIDRFTNALKRYYGGPQESDETFTEQEIAAEFDRWLASVKAEAWDEVAAIVENCHDCLTYSGVKNPYRNSQ